MTRSELRARRRRHIAAQGRCRRRGRRRVLGNRRCPRPGSRGSGSSPPGLARHAPGGIRKPAKPSPSPLRERRRSRPARHFVTRSTPRRAAGPGDSRLSQLPCHRRPTAAHRCALSASLQPPWDVPPAKSRCFLIALRTVERRTEPGFRRRPATPLIPSPVPAPLPPAHPGAGTFVAERRRGELADSSCVRLHARSRTTLEFFRARVPYIAGCEFSPPTVLRIAAQAPYWTRYPVAYSPAVHEPKPLVRSSTKTSPTPTTGRRH